MVMQLGKYKTLGLGQEGQYLGSPNPLILALDFTGNPQTKILLFLPASQ